MTENTQTLEKSKNIVLTLGSILDAMKSGEILFNHPLQRESEQWTPIMKSNFISDILQGNPIPALIFAEQVINGNARIWDLDGKQRCTNALKFMNDEFKISKKVRRWDIEYGVIIRDENGNMILDEYGFSQEERRVFDIRGKKFSQLPLELQKKFKKYNFDITQYINCSSEDIAYHIARYNEGKPMNVSQKGFIELGEYFAIKVKNIVAMPFFTETGHYTTKEATNGTLNRVVVESLMAINFMNNWSKDLKSMSNYLAENATDDMFTNLTEIIDSLTDVIDEDSEHVFNSKDSFLWFATYAKFSELCEDNEKFASFIKEFTNTLHGTEIDGVSYDDICVDKETGKTRSTKDKNIVIAKIEKLTQLLKLYLGVQVEDKDSNDYKDNVDSNIIEDNCEDVAEYTDYPIVDDENGNHYINTSFTQNATYQEVEEQPNNDLSVNEYLLNFVQDVLGEDVDSEDVELYESMVEDCVESNLPIYQTCKSALIALVGYACQLDLDKKFESWIDTIKYCNSSRYFSENQNISYAYLKKDFDIYCGNSSILASA